MAKKKKIPFVAETQDEKEARWARSQKLARSFARQSGLDKKAIAERQKIQKEKNIAKSH